jgi:hypothetical protein
MSIPLETPAARDDLSALDDAVREVVGAELLKAMLACPVRRGVDTVENPCRRKINRPRADARGPRRRGMDPPQPLHHSPVQFGVAKCARHNNDVRVRDLVQRRRRDQSASNGGHLPAQKASCSSAIELSVLTSKGL